MPSPRRIRIRFLVAICIAAALVSAGLGWMTGSWGTALYEVETSSSSFAPIPPRTGGWVGACSSLIACILWCRYIVPMSLHKIAGLRSSAGLAGLGAGVLSATLLHATFMITKGTLNLKGLAIGLGMGAPLGLALGVIGGHLCRLAVTTDLAFRIPRGRRGPRYEQFPHEPDFMDQLDVRSNVRPKPHFRDEYDA